MHVYEMALPAGMWETLDYFVRQVGRLGEINSMC